MKSKIILFVCAFLCSMSSNGQVDSLSQKSNLGEAVIGVSYDTLFYINISLGEFSRKERARNIEKKIKDLYKNDFLAIDSLKRIPSENYVDILYDSTTIFRITKDDAVFVNSALDSLSLSYLNSIKASLNKAKTVNSPIEILKMIAYLALILVILALIIWLIRNVHNRLVLILSKNKQKWLKKISYKDYVLLSAAQEYKIVLLLFKGVKWFFIFDILIIAIPLALSIFPFTRGWADGLFDLIWNPLRDIFISVWEFLPNLFSILAIYFVMRYFIRFVEYIFTEIGSEKLKISGFYPDWAKSTFSIVRFILLAFMFVLIFPYLPGSDSNIFKGVSVFIGVLISLGSSSAISNLIAGLVITYMRPFKIGDRIKIGDVTGDVVEKTILVTRLRTVKNEEITIPNSAVLNGNTTNFSSFAQSEGLILHTTVTIGYDVPWDKMYQVLIEAAIKTDLILTNPKPFVLQTSLDDFYVSYQLNAYTNEVKKQALIYSNLHQNIQDICNQNDIEILSPHYRSQRDGNETTIPNKYLEDNYIAPSFNVNIKKK